MADPMSPTPRPKGHTDLIPVTLLLTPDHLTTFRQIASQFSWQPDLGDYMQDFWGTIYRQLQNQVEVR